MRPLRADERPTVVAGQDGYAQRTFSPPYSDLVPTASAPLPSPVPPGASALRLRGREISAAAPGVMAIINRTRDSFWGGNRHADLESAMTALHAAVDAGADIVDVGGVRAGEQGEEVSPAMEIERVVPFLARAREAYPDLVLSLDTWRAEVAQAAGAYIDVVNDTWQGADPDLVHVTAELGAGIVVSHTGATIFAGTLQTAVDPWGTHSREQAEAALVAASAEDIYESLPGGWQGRIDEKGRGLSGGQRQRLVLARALLLDPETLILVEPTSAVDAHTEARIAERLVGARSGRTTVVVTASPLILRHADAISVLVDGREAARGTHEALAEQPDYRRIISRGMEDTDEPVPSQR